jgi:chaperonin GroES
MNIQPLGERVLIKVLEPELKSKGGLFLPETAKEKPQEGEVVAIGTGKLLDNGQRAEMSVKKGDKVLFGKYSGTEVKVDEEEYLMTKEEEILAILK